MQSQLETSRNMKTLSVTFLLSVITLLLSSLPLISASIKESNATNAGSLLHKFIHDRILNTENDADEKLTTFRFAKEKKKKKKKKQRYIRQYTYLNWYDIHEIMIDLAEGYPELVTLENAQVKFGLPAAGGKDDCPIDHSVRRRLMNLDEKYVKAGKKGFRRSLVGSGCLNWFLVIEDGVAHGFLPGHDIPHDSHRRIPDVLLSGTVHGNERVGPTAVIETTALLLEAAKCEALPHDERPGIDASEIVKDDWADEAKEARSCRKYLYDRGISRYERKWLARLATTRRIVVLPTANSLGYFRGEREEDGIDPNSDFPFDLKEDKKSECMRTIAARTVNEIFKIHMFQLAVTFHAGTSVVAYEWGSPSYDGRLSPDSESQRQIAEGFSRIGGEFPKWNGPPYATGTMNELVFPVRGGMEDWAYAASWDHDHVSVCQPKMNGNYTEQKTQYGSGTNRAFVALIETSKTKSPPSDHLGTDYDLFNPTKKGNGHIPRNMRICFMLLDVVEPYVSILSVNAIRIDDDIVPLRKRHKRACMKTKTINVPEDIGEVTINWVVGGGFTVDETAVLYARWDDLPEAFDGENPPVDDDLDVLTKVINGNVDASDRIIKTPNSYGRTRWHEDGPDPSPPKGANGLSLGPAFSTSIDLKNFREGDTVAVFAFATLDKSWATQPRKSDMEPDVPPQSHIVNVRTNPSWLQQNVRRNMKGHLQWFSIPVTLVIEAPGSPMVESSIRLPPQSESKLKQLGQEMEDEIESHKTGTIIVALLFTFSIVGYLLYKRNKRKKTQDLFKEIDTELDGLELNAAEFTEPDDTEFARPGRPID